MKLFLVIGLGIIASFGLTVLAEFFWLSSGAKTVWHVYPEFFFIPMIVGAGVGFTARRKAVLAAALSLAPWAVWLVVGVNASTTSCWAITIALVSVYFAVGVGAAALVGRRMVRSVARSSQSPSQEHA